MWGLLLSLQPPFYPSEAEKKGATPSQVSLKLTLIYSQSFVTNHLCLVNTCLQQIRFGHKFYFQYLLQCNLNDLWTTITSQFGVPRFVVVNSFDRKCKKYIYKVKLCIWTARKVYPIQANCKYSESRLMLSPVNVIIRLMWSLFIVPFTNAD